MFLTRLLDLLFSYGRVIEGKNSEEQVVKYGRIQLHVLLDVLFIERMTIYNAAQELNQACVDISHDLIWHVYIVSLNTTAGKNWAWNSTITIFQSKYDDYNF